MHRLTPSTDRAAALLRVADAGRCGARGDTTGYAQNDFAEPGLDLPGTRTNAFSDFIYFSLAVATTFGATDVNVTTPRMRKVVNLHVVLTFVYNSVIIALLAGILLR